MGYYFSIISQVLKHSGSWCYGDICTASQSHLAAISLLPHLCRVCLPWKHHSENHGNDSLDSLASNNSRQEQKGVAWGYQSPTNAKSSLLFQSFPCPRPVIHRVASGNWGSLLWFVLQKPQNCLDLNWDPVQGLFIYFIHPPHSRHSSPS